MINTILDTVENLYLSYDPPNSDIIAWVEDRDTEAYEFRDEAKFTTQLNALNTVHPNRFIGGGGVGTPK